MAVVTGTVAAVGAMAKLKAILAGLGFAGKAGAAKLTMGMGGKAATAAATKMAGGAAKTAMAGGLRGKLAANFGKAFAVDPVTGSRGIMGSIAPDLAFGGFTALMTPGDLGDKLIAGGTDAVIGAGMTGGLRGVTGAARGSTLGNAIEYGGGMASGLASFPVSEQLLRMKGGGMSPYDKMQQEQYSQQREQIEDQILQQLMSGRRTPVISDPFSMQSDPGM